VKFASGLRALMRVEWRGIRRHPGRAMLVVLLVAVPVAAMAGGSAMYSTTRRTPEEARIQAMGDADLRIDAAIEPERILDLLPEAHRAVPVAVGRVELRAPGRRVAARSIAIESEALREGGLAHGMTSISAGRAPSEPDEIAVSQSVADRLGARLEGTVEIAGATARIVGIAVDPEDLASLIVLRPNSEASATTWLVDLPDRGSDVALLAADRLRTSGLAVTARSEIGSGDDFERLAIVVIGGFGFFEAALVVSAAFAVGLRRRQREIGLLGATGAPLGALRSALIGSALLQASVGVLLGLTVGLGTARLLQPAFDGWNLRRNGELEIPLDLIGATSLLGLLSALGAAVVPAFSATRLPIRVALSGRRPVTEGTRTWFVIGLALVSLGLAAVAFGASRDGATAAVGVLGGSILGVLGLGACSPWLLGVLARAAAPLPLAWRLAARDAGRFRARNGPVVTAVLAGVSVSLMLATLIGGVERLLATNRSPLRPDQLFVDGPRAETIAEEVALELGAVAVAPIRTAWSGAEAVRARFASGAPLGPTVIVGDAAHARAGAFEDGGSALAAGKLVVLVGPDGDRGAARGTTIALATESGVDLASVPSIWLEVEGLPSTPRVVIGESLLTELGLRAGPPHRKAHAPWLVRLGRDATANDVERAVAIAASSPGSSVDADLLLRAETGPILAVVLVLALVTGVIVVLVATALTSIESAADAHVLSLVGAAPRVLSMHSAARAAYLAALGAVLAVPAGMIPSYGLVQLSSARLEFAVPWREIVLVVFGMPAVAFAGAWFMARVESARGRSRPVG